MSDFIVRLVDGDMARLWWLQFACGWLQFVSTPVCCPSRASLLTGRYQHNTGVLNNTVPGNCCGAAWRRHVEPRTVAAHLHRHGYSTFYAGKYLNQVSRRSNSAHLDCVGAWWRVD